MSYAHSHSHILIRNFYQFLDAGFDRQRPTLVMAEVPLNLPGPRISFRAISIISHDHHFTKGVFSASESLLGCVF
tara:strand:+ start:1678 stop:1902 length:225 start_codon:yes stop_codon:yes gene_type:complete